jgi:hypothetical protein
VSSGEITTEIERFIRDNVDSVEQLEVLLLLRSAPDKEWGALEVSQTLYRQPESVATRLNDLRERGFLSVNQASPPLYQYSPNPQDSEIITGLEHSYRVRKDAVIQMIFSKPKDSLRTFSDAFRIRRNK